MLLVTLLSRKMEKHERKKESQCSKPKKEKHMKEREKKEVGPTHEVEMKLIHGPIQPITCYRK